MVLVLAFGASCRRNSSLNGSPQGEQVVPADSIGFVHSASARVVGAYCHLFDFAFDTQPSQSQMMNLPPFTNLLDRFVVLWHSRIETPQHMESFMQQRTIGTFECPTTFSTKIDTSGRIVIPSALRERLHLSPGDELVVEERAGLVTLSTYDRILAQAQEYFTSLIPAGVSLVDELRIERREAFEREQAAERGHDE